MSEDKPEIKPEFNKPEIKSEFDNSEIKPQRKPIIKSKFKKDRQPVQLRFRFKFFFIIFILAPVIYFGSGPAIESAAKFIIGKIFVDSTVSIGSLSIKPTHQISFHDITIKRGQIYDMVIKEANLDFTWPALFKKITPELSLKNVLLTANSPKVRLADLANSIKIMTNKKVAGKVTSGQAKAKTPGQVKAKTQEKTNAPVPLISKLDIPDLNFDLNIQGLKANGLVSFSLNLLTKEISFLNLNAKQLSVGMVSLEDVDLNALQGQRKGNLKIRQVNLGKLVIKNAKSMAVLEGLILSLDDISGVFLSKKVIGEMTMNLWPILECTLNAKFGGISALALAEELGWEDTIKLSGKLYGKVIFRSEGKALAMLNVKFISSSAGATLAISDAQTLRKISKESKLALADVSESFLDYRYEKGQLIASLLDDTLGLEIILDGQQGRRNLRFNLKDVNILGAN